MSESVAMKEVDRQLLIERALTIESSLMSRCGWSHKG